MLHAREDYNERIQDSKNIIPQDEPVFLLRGQDRFASKVLKYYIQLLEEDNSDPVSIEQLNHQFMMMNRWQINHGWKNPDTLGRERTIKAGVARWEDRPKEERT